MYAIRLQSTGGAVRRGLVGIAVALSLGAIACDSPADVPDTTPPPAPAPVAMVMVSGVKGPAHAGDTIRMKAELRTATGQPAAGQVVWSSSDTALATVSADGLVTTHFGGTVTIVATSGAVQGQQSLFIVDPRPVLSSLHPATAQRGDDAFFITVTGTNFGPDAVVMWGAQTRPTIRVSATELRAEIAAADLAAAGTFLVGVKNQGGPGSTSDWHPFTVTPRPMVEQWITYRLQGLETGEPLPFEHRRGTFVDGMTGITYDVIRRIAGSTIEIGGSAEEGQPIPSTFVYTIVETLHDQATGAQLRETEYVTSGAVEYDMWDGSLILVSGLNTFHYRGRWTSESSFVVSMNLGGGALPWLFVRE